MEGWLGGAYLWVKAFHLLSVLFWMAALFMMPRFFAYHVEELADAEAAARWAEREQRLHKIIMNPSMMAAWILGLSLTLHVGFAAGGWLHAKLLLVVAMTVFHILVSGWRRAIGEGRARSSRYYRLANEVPTLLSIPIVILVIVKPF